MEKELKNKKSFLKSLENGIKQMEKEIEKNNKTVKRIKEEIVEIENYIEYKKLCEKVIAKKRIFFEKKRKVPEKIILTTKEKEILSKHLRMEGMEGMEYITIAGLEISKKTLETKNEFEIE